MPYIKINQLPKIRFAHVFGATEYKNSIPPEKNVIEISYVSEGETEVQDGSERYRMTKYSLSINLRNSQVKIKADKFHEHHTVCFEVEFEVTEGKDSVCLPRALHFKEKDTAHDIVDEIIKIYTLYPERELKVGGLILSLLDQINTVARGTTQRTDLTSLYVIKAKNYVYKHLHKPILQKEIAEHLDLTPEYLCWVFKKHTGVTLMKFINTTKLSKIRMLMMRENFKLYRAAAVYGYDDANYVSKLYKKYYGRNITDFSSQKSDY